MNVGGTDIIIHTGIAAGSALELATRCVLRHWPSGLVENGDGHVYGDIQDVPFTTIDQLFVHRDMHTLGSDEQNTMVYLIGESNSLTLVVDDPKDPTMKSIIEELCSMTLPTGTWQMENTSHVNLESFNNALFAYARRNETEIVQWGWMREDADRANGPFDSRDEAWADAARELGRNANTIAILGTCKHELPGQYMPGADAILEQFADCVENSDEWSWSEDSANNIFATDDLPPKAREELEETLVTWADKYIGRSKIWCLEAESRPVRTCDAPVSAPSGVQFNTADTDFTAYLVGVLDTENQKLLGAEVFSEPTPTLGFNRYPFTIASMTGKTYADAKAKLEAWINDDNSHVAWVRHIYRWVRENGNV